MVTIGIDPHKRTHAASASAPATHRTVAASCRDACLTFVRFGTATIGDGGLFRSDRPRGAVAWQGRCRQMRRCTPRCRGRDRSPGTQPTSSSSSSSSPPPPRRASSPSTSSCSAPATPGQQRVPTSRVRPCCRPLHHETHRHRAHLQIGRLCTTPPEPVAMNDDDGRSGDGIHPTRPTCRCRVGNHVYQ